METFHINLEIPPIGKVPIFLRRWGHGPKVLFLHGWLDTSLKWQRSGEHLSPHYQVWAPDLPGCGQTPAIPLRYTKFEIYAEILAKLIEHIDEGKELHSLVGHSMGGLLSLLLLQKSYCSTKHLITCGAPISGVRYLIPLTNRTNFVATGLKTLQALPNALQSPLMRFGNIVTLRSWKIEKHQRQNLHEINMATAAVLLKQICACNLLEQLTPRPTNLLVIRGQYDPFVSRAASVQLAETLGGTFYEFEKAHHSPMLEQPDQFHHLIQQFLEKTA
jgi:pimeloyl-ACP methyl ester carboxylesterase